MNTDQLFNIIEESSNNKPFEYTYSSPSQLSKVHILDIYMANHKGFIAGGCFKDLFKGERIRDIDIFFEKMEDFNEAKNYYSTDDEYIFSYENDRVIAYKNTVTNVRVELIFGTFGTPEDIVGKFDFSITKFAYFKHVEGNYETLYHPKFFEHLINNKLVLEETIHFPVSTFERTYKYAKKGYGLCKESKVNLIMALQGVDPNNVSNNLYFGLD